MIGLGTIVNAAAVVAGASLGLRLGGKLPQGSRETIFTVIGLFTAYLGVSMSLGAKTPVSLVLGTLIGTLVGEWWRIEEAFEKSAENLRKRVGGGSTFIEGLMAAFLTYCVGPMTIIGSLKDGMGDPSILLAKSVMDGFVSVAYAAAMGVGVAFAAIPLLLFQGSLAVLGYFLGVFLPQEAISGLTASGGLMLLGLSLNLLGIKRVKVANMLPSLAIVPLLAHFLGA